MRTRSLLTAACTLSLCTMCMTPPDQRLVVRHAWVPRLWNQRGLNQHYTILEA